MDSPFQDLRYALRTPSRRPGSTTAAVLTLALGVDATGNYFDVLGLRPAPAAS